MSTTAAGWYPDPNDASLLRWWDGHTWTDHTEPAQPSGAGAASMPDTPTPSQADPNGGSSLAAEPLDGTAPDGLDIERERWLAHAREEFSSTVAMFDSEKQRLSAELAAAQAEIDDVQDVLDIQQLGLVFEGEHPTAKSVEYKEVITVARDRRKAAAKDGSAVIAAQDWAIGGSVAEGKKLTAEISKLMLRAYNNELDALVKATSATNAESKVKSLTKKREQIKKLGARLGIEISLGYHNLGVYEIEQTSNWLAAKLIEKEREREHREQLREEKKVAEQIAREQAKLDKELTQYQQALEAMEASPDTTEAEVQALREQIAEVEAAQSDVTKRAANTRAGHVYVISNPGSFGEGVVKIGMTRRLDPLDRVAELGDASVPFRFSVHALIFADDAVSLENELHKRFSDFRVNRVNLRREFFRVTPEEVRGALIEFNAHLVEWDSDPVDEEWEVSR